MIYQDRKAPAEVIQTYNNYRKLHIVLKWKAQQDISASVFWEFNFTFRRTKLALKQI